MQDQIDTYKTYSTIVLCICSILEMIFFPSLGNLVGILVTVASHVIYCETILQEDFFCRYPIFAIMSVWVYGLMILALPATLLDGVSMTHDFYNPELTFLLQFIYFVLFLFIIIKAAEYSDLLRGLNSVLERIGYFEIPSFANTFILAAFGWVFQLLLLKNQFSGEGNYVSNLGTYHLFSVFIYFPLINLVRSLLNDEECTGRQKTITWVYFVVLTVSMAATNSRGAVLAPTMMLASCLLLKFFCNPESVLIFTRRNVGIILIASYIITGPFNDMAFAMLIARGERHGSDYSELFDSTIKYYQDKELLKKYRKLLESESNDLQYNDWNEDYVSNVFLQRFCNYRVLDASIHHALNGGLMNEKMQRDFFDHMISVLPQPVLSIVDPSMEKDKLAYSQMDLLYSISTHGANKESYIVGGDVGLGLSTFGIFYFPLMMLVYFIEMILISNLVKFDEWGNMQFSALTLITLSSIMERYHVGGGFIDHVNFITWNFWWLLLWQFISFKIISALKFK